VRKDGKVTGIVEHKDATDEEKQIGEINAGIYIADSAFSGAAREARAEERAGRAVPHDIVTAAARSGP